MEEQGRSKRREEAVETTLAAAGATLFVSGLKKIISYINIEWRINLMVAPSPLLFLLLHIIIASIFIISNIQTNNHRSHSPRRRVGHEKEREKRRKKRSNSKREEKEREYNQEDEGSDAEELNARAEAFISAFRQQLRVDSFGSRGVSEA